MVKSLVIDLVGLIGLVLLGYGLYLQAPWLAFSVTGSLMIIFSVYAGRNK